MPPITVATALPAAEPWLVPRRQANRRRSSASRVVAAALACCALALGGCRHLPAGTRSPHAEARLRALYDSAIADAAVVEPGEMAPLRPLVADATGQVAVVTLTDWTYPLGENELSRDVWVTLVPEVRERCRTFRGDVGLRLRQLLGTPPHKPIVHFAELRVAAGDVFRPALDPTTTTAAPCADTASPVCATGFPATVGERHRSWVASQMVASYVRTPPAIAPTGYPWTRLGYTYDWAPRAREVGVSEYVVPRGTKVTVVALTPYAAYCAPGHSADAVAARD
jgi:hypothetical protein